MNKRSYLEINLSILKENYEICISKMVSRTPAMAVVKADAYGHGDIVISKTLFDCGIRFFAVSNIDEAIHLRKAGIEGEILILGYTSFDRANELIAYDITQALISEEYAEILASMHLPVKCHFAIDTGMRRIGIKANEIDECERIIRLYSTRLRLMGLFTHLCVADSQEQDAFTEKQIALFENVCYRVIDLNLPYYHCLNSAGGLWHFSGVSSITRLGIVLYGLKPDYQNTLPDGIKPVLSWKTVVSMIKTVDPGDTIGYGRTFTVKQPMIIATIPTGYADGYPRLLSNKGWVLINGYKAPIVGRICMDQMMVDITDVPDVGFETEVVLIGKSGKEIITADDLANQIGTIGYEIVYGISGRVTKYYIE